MEISNIHNTVCKSITEISNIYDTVYESIVIACRDRLKKHKIKNEPLNLYKLYTVYDIFWNDAKEKFDISFDKFKEELDNFRIIREISPLEQLSDKSYALHDHYKKLYLTYFYDYLIRNGYNIE